MASNKGSTLTPDEKRYLSEFVRYASTEWARSQYELAEAAGISQSMIAYVLSGTRPAGGKTIRAIAEATGVSIEEMLSGAGLSALRSRASNGLLRDQSDKRHRATEALAKLFNMQFSEVEAIFEDNRIILPSSAPVTSWFDLGRAYIEQRQATGLVPAKKT